MNECKIVEDLLPLYSEELLSNESRDFVQEHCKHCESCDKLRNRAMQPVREEYTDTKIYKKAFRKEIIRFSMKGALCIVALVLVVGLLVLSGTSDYEDPVVFESPDGVHRIESRYWSGVYGLMEGVELKEVWRNGMSQGGHHPWRRIREVIWSPDGTCAFVTLEMLNGETGMYLSMNRYTEERNSSWMYPSEKPFWDLNTALEKLCKVNTDFPSGWQNINFAFLSWVDENETVAMAYETDNGLTGTINFNVVTETIVVNR